MSTYDLEEQEQLASLKAWWKQHGGLLVMLIAGAALLFSGWNAWNWYQRSQAGKAASQFEMLHKFAAAHDLKGVKESAGIILEQFPRTSYAAMAALISAREHIQAGDRKTARAQLEWTVANSRNPELRAIARVRLASLLLDEGVADQAVKTLEEKPQAGFEALFAATRGDAWLSQGKVSEAREAYRMALAVQGIDPDLRQLVQAKLDTLGDS